MEIARIPLSEFRRASPLYRFTNYDEGADLGMLRLRSDGQHRTWIGTDGSEGMVVYGGSDRNEYDLGLSWALISAAEALSGGHEESELRIETGMVGDSPVIHLIGPLGRSTFWDRQATYPAISRPLLAEERVAGSATVTVEALRAALQPILWKRVDGDDKDSSDAITMIFDDDQIILQKRERGVGRFDVFLAAPGAWSDVTLDVSSHALRRLLDAAHPSDEATITVSRWNSDVVSFESENWFGFIHPYRTPNAVAITDVEKLLGEMFGPVALHKDDDGDYPLRLHGNPIYGRFHRDEDDTLWFRVFAIVVHDIAGSPEVFHELNELNANTTFVRIFHIDDQILAEVDLLAATLDWAELDAAINRISSITDVVMPTLTAVLGGSVPADASERRWTNYRSTILEAEIIPGRLFNLNGPEAMEEFPFPDTCWAITAWNPMGTTRPANKNRELNQAVAKDIVDHGGMFVRGFGASPEGDYSEETLFVWGLTRDDVRSMGRRAQQDAIFEIDANQVRLVSCFDSRVEEWARRPAT